MNVVVAALTYFAYLFIIAMYGCKIVRYLALPVHLRWELYPLIGGEAEASRFEKPEWWNTSHRKRRVKGVLYLLKEYLHLGEYFRRHLSYWAVLYPWHVGFIFIIIFHVLCLFGGVVMALGFEVSPESGDTWGKGLCYAILATGAVSFIAGAVGSMGLPVVRLLDRNLRLYATPLNYMSYLLTLLVFLSGLYAWYFADPALSEYREFWKGLVTFRLVSVAPASVAHIILFDLFLIYLPFTRSMHYITRFFAFFLIRWDDRPNVRGSELEGELIRLQARKVSWKGPHIKPGNTWSGLAKDDQGTG